VTRRFARIAVAALAIPSSLVAQADTVGAAASTWAAEPVPSVDTANVFFERNGQRQLGIVYIETIARAPGGFMIVQQNMRPTGVIVTLDTVVFAAKTFAPLWHADRTPRGSTRVSFANGRVRGTSTDTAGVVTAIDTRAAADLIDFSVASSFTRLLPLRPGYSAVVKSYDIHRGVVHTPVHVVGEETLTIGDRRLPTWKVESRNSNGQVVTHWIDQKTRRELRVSASVGPSEMAMERAP
jgi:hypothetical protein